MKTILFIFCTTILSFAAQSQDNLKEKKWSESEIVQHDKAQLLLSEKNYRLALPIFEKLLTDHPNDPRLKYSYGICGLSRPGLQAVCLKNLQEVYEKNKKAHEIEFYLAKANFLNSNFDEALTLVNAHAAKLKKPTDEEKKEIDEFINYCNNAKKLVAEPVKVKIENMGNLINTAASESAPCLTDDESVIIYTYKGENSVGGLQNAFNQPDKNGLYYEDVYRAVKERNNWLKPEGISNLNTKNNEAVLFLSNDGNKLFIAMDSQQDDGDIYMSTLDNNVWGLPEKLIGDVNTEAWEDNSSLSPDGKTLFFSSTRAGGFGGKDIYMAKLLPNGSWSNVKNLGDKINTPLDDDAPFIHYDGRLLLFSSKGHNSMGGYDIFKTYLNLKDSTWSTPENMGYPINTPADDNHYVLSPSGETGYYSLGRTDGYGDLDIYTVEPGITGIMPVVAVVKGTVSLDNGPVEADITVEIPSKNSVFRKFKASMLTGNYRVTLPVGEDYKITWKINDFDPKSEMIAASKVEEHMVKISDINFVTAKDTTLADSTKTKPGLGDEVIEGLVYKIQVSSESLARKLKKKLEHEYGDIDKIMFEGQAKFVLKNDFKTLREVTKQVESVRSSAVHDAFVVGMYKGKRYHLFELRKLGILPTKKSNAAFSH